MKLEEQVCSLELAKRLKELGVTSNPSFHWVQWSGKDWSVCSREMLSFSENKEVLNRVGALGVAELGEQLPSNTTSWKGDDSWLWFCMQDEKEDVIFRAKTEADARAKMLIHLIEKGIVTVQGEGKV